jgi:hypothetical protein
VLFVVITGDPANSADEADVGIVIRLNDVRRKSDLADYTGEVLVNHTLRITDRYNGPGENEPGTMVEHDFPIFPSCMATADPGEGSTCNLTTSADARVPGAIKEGKRTIWQLGEIRVFDGGADGSPSSLPNDMFLRQGVFVP